MRVKEVATRLDVSANTVYSLVSNGKLRCCRIGRGRGVIRISEEQLGAYLRSAEPQPPAVVPEVRRVRLKHIRLP